MSRLIIGYGKKGRYIDELLRSAGQTADIYDIINEKIPNGREIKSSKYDVCHICVDSNDIIELCKNIIKLYSPKLLVVHSTTQVGTLDLINHDVVHHPLFFRNTSVIEDVEKPKLVVLSCNNWNNEEARKWLELMMDYAVSTKAEFNVYDDLKVTEFIKIAIERIVSELVMLYNELCKKAISSGINKEIIKSVVTNVLRMDFIDSRLRGDIKQLDYFLEND